MTWKVCRAAPSSLLNGVVESDENWQRLHIQFSCLDDSAYQESFLMFVWSHRLSIIHSCLLYAMRCKLQCPNTFLNQKIAVTCKNGKLLHHFSINSCRLFPMSNTDFCPTPLAINCSLKLMKIDEDTRDCCLGVVIRLVMWLHMVSIGVVRHVHGACEHQRWGPPSLISMMIHIYPSDNYSPSNRPR